MEVKDILIWVFIFVVGSIVFQFIVYPESFNSLKEDVHSSAGSLQEKIQEEVTSPQEQDTLTNSCLDSYQACKYIAENKFGISIKLIEYQKFTDLESATSFINTWKNPLVNVAIDPLPEEKDLPVVVFATRQEKDGEVLPTVFVCNNNGELIQSLTKNMLCG